MNKDRNRNFTIAVVDDDPAIRLSTTRLLRNEGYTVTEAASGAEGEALIRETRPDLVLMDVNLGDADGRDLCEKLRRDKNMANTLWVLVSNTFTSSTDQTDGLLRGADSYIARPIENSELLARVSAFIRIVAARKEQQAALEELEHLDRENLQEIAALKIFNRAAVDRELRMIELKREINALCRELGRDEPYA